MRQSVSASELMHRTISNIRESVLIFPELLEHERYSSNHAAQHDSCKYDALIRLRLSHFHSSRHSNTLHLTNTNTNIYTYLY